MSVLVFAGGSQFLAVAVVASGGGLLTAVLGGLLLNARHIPFGLSLVPMLRGRLLTGAITSQLVIDESTAFALAQPTPELGRRTFYTVGITLSCFRQAGTAIGAYAGGAPGDPTAAGVDAALPAGLLALPVPQLRGRTSRVAALCGALLALASTPVAAPILLAGGCRRDHRRAGTRMTWPAVLALALGTYAMKAARPLVLGSRRLPAEIQTLFALLAVALLSALIAVSTFAAGKHLQLDARAAGVAAAAAVRALI